MAKTESKETQQVLIDNFVRELYAHILKRKNDDPSESYTAYLMSKGRAHIAQKLGEEAVEAVLAAAVNKPDQLIYESADLLYHLLVLWVDVGVTPDDVARELESRRGRSGLKEKLARKG